MDISRFQPKPIILDPKKFEKGRKSIKIGQNAGLPFEFPGFCYCSAILCYFSAVWCHSCDTEGPQTIHLRYACETFELVFKQEIEPS